MIYGLGLLPGALTMRSVIFITGIGSGIQATATQATRARTSLTLRDGGSIKMNTPYLFIPPAASTDGLRTNAPRKHPTCKPPFLNTRTALYLNLQPADGNQTARAALE